MNPGPRRRGRPRKDSSSDARAAIADAASAEFAEKGYDKTSIRGIARRAQVDSALVHHYFGTKADLFAEAAGIPLRPDLDVPEILAGPKAQAGARLVRYVLDAFEKPDVRRRGVLLLRTAIGSRLTTPLLAGFLSRELLSRVARRLDVQDADLRAALVASQIAGMLIGRYVLQLPALAGASVDELVGRVGPTVQRYLFD